MDEESARIELSLDRRADNKALLIVDAEGNTYGELSATFRHPMPADFDEAREARRARAGGCCGQPTD